MPQKKNKLKTKFDDADKFSRTNDDFPVIQMKQGSWNYSTILKFKHHLHSKETNTIFTKANTSLCSHIKNTRIRVSVVIKWNLQNTLESGTGHTKALKSIRTLETYRNQTRKLTKLANKKYIGNKNKLELYHNKIVINSINRYLDEATLSVLKNR